MQIGSHKTLSLEHLERRWLLAGFEPPTVWSHHDISFSLIPDGATIESAPNNLTALLNDTAPRHIWQREIARALQVWTNISPLNFHAVGDDGTVEGHDGKPQHDSRFGDIRLASLPTGNAMAKAYLPSSVSTLGGDVYLNLEAFETADQLSERLIRGLAYALGLDRSVQPQVSSSYTVDAASETAFQELYGQRAPDEFDVALTNDDFDSATRIQLAADGATALRADLTTRSDVDYYTFRLPNEWIGTLSVHVSSQEISQLAPRVRVYDASHRLLAWANATVSDSRRDSIPSTSHGPNQPGFFSAGFAHSTYTPIQGVDVDLLLDGVIPGQTLYVAVDSATRDEFQVGAYQLRVAAASVDDTSTPPTIIRVTNDSELSTALASVRNLGGGTVVLAPGLYTGGIWVANLTDATIRSEYPNNRAIIRGGASGIQLVDAENVTIEELVFEQQSVNGLNIDDGGTFETPSHGIKLRQLTIRDLAPNGNHDGIKLAGVDDVHVDRVNISNWGVLGGSAIDMVGAHHVLIENSLFTHNSLQPGAVGVQAKGGSKNIVVRANRIELTNGNGRAIQAGGSTGAPYYRFIDGDSDYEADDFVAEGNVILGGNSSFSYVNIDGGDFRLNYLESPTSHSVRILNENSSNPSMVSTRNGIFRENVVVTDRPAWTINIGPNTHPDTYTFAGNQWYNPDSPSDSTPVLPTTETGGTYGVAPLSTAHNGQAWDVEWGLWLVNATGAVNNIDLPSDREFIEALPLAAARFESGKPWPFEGDWEFATTGPQSMATLSKYSQRFFLDALLAAPVARFVGNT